MIRLDSGDSATFYLERLPQTILLVEIVLGFVILVGTLMGVASAKKAYLWVDGILSVVCLALFVILVFWVGLVGA